MHLRSLALVLTALASAAPAFAQQAVSSSASPTASNYSGTPGVSWNCDGWTWYFTQTADYVTNVSLPAGLTPNARFGFSFLNSGDPTDPMSNLPGNLITNGLSNDFSRISLGTTANVSTGALPLIPFNQLSVTTGAAVPLPGGQLGFISGLLGGGGAGTGVTAGTVVTPAFQDDWRFQTAGGVNRQFAVNEFTSVSVGGNYYQALHSSLEQFDLQVPSTYGLLGVRLTDRLIAALQYNYEYSFLEYDSFASVHRATPALTYVASDLWIFQTSYSYADINFRPAPAFNSSNHLAKTEAIRLLGSSYNYLLGGYAFGKSDAAVNSFSYDAQSVYGGIRTLFGPTNRNEFQFLASLGLYDFDNVDVLQTNTVRYDKIYTVSPRLGHWFTNWFNIYGQYTFASNDSNIARQDYDSSVISMGAEIYR